MKYLSVALIIIWLFTGVLVLFKNKISKVDYLLIWTVLMLQLIENAILKR